jgi:hypothetical protein
MLKPKHSFQAVVNELAQGLRSGEIVLRSDSDSSKTPMMRRMRFRESSWVDFTSPPVSFVNIRWDEGVATLGAR